MSVVATKRPAPLSTVEQVWEAVVRLASGQLRLPPGGQLPGVRNLAEMLGEKPTLVRDALLHAQAHGAVRIVPRVGVFMQSPASNGRTPAATESSGADLKSALEGATENVLHVLDARRLLEIELIGRAAERRRVEDLMPARNALEALLRLPAEAPREQYTDLDIQFHIAIGRLGGNQVLARMQETLLEVLRPHLYAVPDQLQRRPESDESHAAVYTALVEGSVEKAREAMRVHLSLAYDAMLGEVRRLPTLPNAGSKSPGGGSMPQV